MNNHTQIRSEILAILRKRVANQECSVSYQAPVQYGEHSPKGGWTSNGVFYPGGQFIPNAVIAGASSQERAQLQQRKAQEAGGAQEVQQQPQAAPQQTANQEPAQQQSSETHFMGAPREALNSKIPVQDPNEPIIPREQWQEMIQLGLMGYKAANGNVFEPLDQERERPVVEAAARLAAIPAKDYPVIQGQIYERGRSAQRTNEDIVNYRAARLISAYRGYRNRKLARESAAQGMRNVLPKAGDVWARQASSVVRQAARNPRGLRSRVAKSDYFKAPLYNGINKMVGADDASVAAAIQANPAAQDAIVAKANAKKTATAALTEHTGELVLAAITTTITAGVPALISWMAKRNLQNRAARMGQTLQLQSEDIPVKYAAEAQADPRVTAEEFLRAEFSDALAQDEEVQLEPQDHQAVVEAGVQQALPLFLKMTGLAPQEAQQRVPIRFAGDEDQLSDDARAKAHEIAVAVSGEALTHLLKNKPSIGNSEKLTRTLSLWMRDKIKNRLRRAMPDAPEVHLEELANEKANGLAPGIARAALDGGPAVISQEPETPVVTFADDGRMIVYEDQGGANLHHHSEWDESEVKRNRSGQFTKNPHKDWEEKLSKGRETRRAKIERPFLDQKFRGIPIPELVEHARKVGFETELPVEALESLPHRDGPLDGSPETQERTAACDLSKPLLLLNGEAPELLDGRHRVQKAKDTGVGSLPVLIFNELPAKYEGADDEDVVIPDGHVIDPQAGA